MADTPYPIPRELRQTAVLSGDGVNATYGPFAFKIFDIEDVAVYTKVEPAIEFSLVATTVAKVSGLAQDFFTVTFPAPLALTTEFVVTGARLAERSAGITKGTVLDQAALEKELSKQAVITQELRRDVDRAFKADFSQEPQLLPPPEPGKFLGWTPDGALQNFYPPDFINAVFESRSQAQASLVPLPMQRISVVAHTGFIVDYVRDAAGTALTTADGAKWSPDGEAFPQHWGWEPGLSTADQTTLLIAMLTWGGECTLPFGYTFETDYVLVDLTRDLRLRVNGTHKASAEPSVATQAMMRLNASPSNRWHMTVEGEGTIDCSAKVVIPGEASGSAYLFYYSDFLTVRGPLTFFAGATLGAATADTAIVPSYCQRTLIDGCRFLGFADHSIYTTGGPTGSETQRSYDLDVTNCLFVGNAAGAVRVAREHKRVSVTNNVCRDGGRLFISAGGETNLKSASMIDVSHNKIYNTYATAIDIRYPDADTAVTVIGNHVYDWGGTELAPAIRLLGVSNFDVSHNVCVPYLATQGVGTTSCGTGIYIEEHAGDDAAPYACRNGKVTDNTVEVFTRSGFSNAPFVARFITQVGVGTGLNEIVVHDNTLIYPVGLIDMIVTFDSVDALRGAKYIRRNKDGNIGYRGADPRTAVEFMGTFGVSRTSDAARYVEIDMDSATLAILRGRSPTTQARQFAINATTDALNTAPTAGAAELLLQSLGITRVAVKQQTVAFNVPVYANNAAAVAAGLAVGDAYITSAAATTWSRVI